MMKINLLGHAAQATEAAPAVSSANRQALSFAVPLVAALLVVGVFNYFWKSELQTANNELAAQQAEQRELQQVEAQNQTYRQELATLQQRINTIQNLQTARTGPVQLMSALGLLVDKAKDLYLNSVNPNGNSVQLKGTSDSVQSIAQFITSLNHSGVFTNVLLHRYYQRDRGPRRSFQFSLSCDFQPPSSAASGSGPAKPAAMAGR